MTAESAPTAAPLRLISSMATRALLAELAERHAQLAGVPVQVESVGGVDAARRVAAGEPFDVVVLARDALDTLAQAGQVQADTLCDLVLSRVAIAVPEAAAAVPDVSTEAALRAAVQASGAGVGYSTGPSGTALLALLQRWGLRDALQAEGRLRQAPAGVPVAALLARGEVGLGFQQRSELQGAPGIRILGGMPPGCEIDTRFSAAVCSASAQQLAAQALIAFLASPQAHAAMQRQGMEPAPPARPPLPDRLSVEAGHPHFNAAACEHDIGIRFNGSERHDVQEYCLSEGWIRVPAGKTLDRRGKPLLIKLKGRVEAFYR